MTCVCGVSENMRICHVFVCPFSSLCMCMLVVCVCVYSLLVNARSAYGCGSA